MARAARHRYRDPLDQVWVATARAIGLRVERSRDAYASSDGRRTLFIGDEGSLDPDDCLAQMILHELCHSLVEGDTSFAHPDWGLDNSSDRDVPREHACLRLQAFLAGRHGLRWFLAPTTDHRAFYDALPADPFEPRRDPATQAAILGARRAAQPPWGPHLERALAATAAIARAAAPFAEREPRDPPPAPLFSAVEDPPPPHPLGGAAFPAAGGRRCGSCAWRAPETGACRQRGGTAEPGWPGCERWEPALDCQTCGACCRAAYHSVEVERDDPVLCRHPDLAVDHGRYVELRRAGDRCAALEGSLAEGFRCAIYPDRPRPCREFEVGEEHCLTARRRVGLSL